MVGLLSAMLVAGLFVSQPSDSVKQPSESITQHINLTNHKIPLDSTKIKEGAIVWGVQNLPDSMGVDTAYVLYKGIMRREKTTEKPYIQLYGNHDDAEKQRIIFRTRGCRRDRSLPMYFSLDLIRK